MAIVKRLCRILGMVCLLTGLLWIGQGLGLVHWPESSFMIDARPWAWRGAGLALLGLGMLFLSRRIGR
ncbi:hypothetical protein KFK14_16080 [Sphingobium phenoxybenzoativorans]|uniref:Uncharacterized protein n=1 Tax=Sphingobium phenoxybenzoativorans TaxID=1592790 RepID=A0A975Q0F0_9SPHN|nr:hypothetical protein [Sphingobium phenoxybenzoativorans]QUT04556.1 hypothetical protein KFK14_16080 [Sphingobium phenoxybenzoativorans]